MNLTNIDYDNKIFLDNFLDNFICYDLNQSVYLEKTLSSNGKNNYYFIKSYKYESEKQTCLGYIYFTLDFKKRNSTYIGTYVKPNYRGFGISSILTSIWISICLNNDIYDLTTNIKQRKPFLLYLLKTYKFELENIEKYRNSKYNIHICRKYNDMTKYLLFENKKQEYSFSKGKIFQSDNYSILDNIDTFTEKLDTILLSNIYSLNDRDFAYQKALKTLNR